MFLVASDTTVPAGQGLEIPALRGNAKGHVQNFSAKEGVQRPEVSAQEMRGAQLATKLALSRFGVEHAVGCVVL